jgi:hypothetical protein
MESNALEKSRSVKTVTLKISSSTEIIGNLEQCGRHIMISIESGLKGIKKFIQHQVFHHLTTHAHLKSLR